ncbi:DUF4249 domain-containing protein [Ulvibacterium sp.]|uniref:DUF4249 domain-containing protein n=1 Tax=Ulvibacterium sp. TaxID=2665914 RepID=UPI0026330995|nr:DUF4249 domain-containing protein [Ulvibacterium sp.]
MHPLITYKKQLSIPLLGMIVVLCSFGCTEPFEGTVDGFEDVLVIDAIITNENKRQEVRLTRSFRFDEEGPQAEENAVVTIEDGEGEQFVFREEEPGIYLSSAPFAAEMGKNYSLSITTTDGKSYRSDTMQLPAPSTTIDELYAERTTNDQGEEGMGIFVDTFDPSRQSNYYRYEYEETFKIIAPLWSPNDVVFIIQLSTGPVFEIILREREERVCYGTNREKTIEIANTLNLSEDRLSRFPVRFINRDNYILSHRYSILVRQYVQTQEAFAYYEDLKGLSQSPNSVFTEDQPGFLPGNVFSLDDDSENVAGFFEVTTVTEERIFFSYEDFFPGEDLPPYVQECVTSPAFGEDLKGILDRGTSAFYEFNPGEGGYILTSRECGDCTALGSNKVPDFWVE